MYVGLLFPCRHVGNANRLRTLIRFPFLIPRSVFRVSVCRQRHVCHSFIRLNKPARWIVSQWTIFLPREAFALQSHPSLLFLDPFLARMTSDRATRFSQGPRSTASPSLDHRRAANGRDSSLSLSPSLSLSLSLSLFLSHHLPPSVLWQPGTACGDGRCL